MLGIAFALSGTRRLAPRIRGAGVIPVTAGSGHRVVCGL